MLRLPSAMAGRYRLATEHEIRSWSFGRVVSPRSFYGKGWEQQRGTLDDQSIFGPVQDYHCACGKYQELLFEDMFCEHCGEYQGSRAIAGMICDRCGVKVTKCEVRRSRFGDIELPFDVPHPLGEDTDQLSVVPVLPAALFGSKSGAQLANSYDGLIRAVNAEAGESVVLHLRCLVEGLVSIAAMAHEWDFQESVTIAHGLALERCEPGAARDGGR